MLTLSLLIFSDHGLYIPLSSDFRRKYCELWYAIFIIDIPTIKRICEGWGIGQAELFASATLLKPFRAPALSENQSSESTPDVEKMTPEELKQLLEDKQLQTALEIKEKIKTFLTDVELVPKELIFIGRAMRILQANNQAMGTRVLT